MVIDSCTKHMVSQNSYILNEYHTACKPTPNAAKKKFDENQLILAPCGYAYSSFAISDINNTSGTIPAPMIPLRTRAMRM